MEPSEQKAPAGHAVLSSGLARSVAFEYVPCATGSGLLAPCSQYEPAPHARQAVAPAADWYDPALQLLQALWPVLSAIVPGVH